mgnify:CR=1 FL=1
MQYALRASLLLVFTITVFFTGCKKADPLTTHSAVVAVSSDIERINPLFSFSVTEANINELLFLSLVKHTWSNKDGDLTTESMAAKTWQWANDSSSIVIEIRDDIKWSDGQKFSLDDIIYSFDLYSDPAVQSYLYGTFKNFYADKENHVDVKKTFEKISPLKLKINFIPKSNPSMFCLDFPIIPKHVFEKIERKNLVNADINFNPVTDGPFAFEKWDKNQAVVIKKNHESYLAGDGNVEKMIFKIAPEYAARLIQLKNGEVDLAEDLKAEDVTSIKATGKFNVVSVKGREYDYVGWNNIDPQTFSKNKKIVLNKLFGSVKVRQALSMAINRSEILKEYLGEFGQLANSPISPMFKNAVNANLKPYPFDLEKAKKLLAEDGWRDNDKDGILEKNGTKLKFILSVSSNKPRRIFAANLMKNTFKQIGVDFEIEQLELGAFIDKLNRKSFDAWIAGWAVPIPVDLKISWYSDLEKTPMNFCGYQNKNADKILDEIEKTSSTDKKNKLCKEFENILYQDQPVTFLYWIDNIVAYNNKIHDIDVNPLGVIHHCWKWHIN